jgi:hypothetical protein
MHRDQQDSVDPLVADLRGAAEQMAQLLSSESLALPLSR